MDLSRYTHIIWDWNGTLLNDAWLCVEFMNSILSDYQLPSVSLSRYRDLFDFPVKNYYTKIGFNFERVSFEVVGMEFMHRYNDRQPETGLFPEVMRILSFIDHKGFTQSILSAREQQELRMETERLGVSSFFNPIIGMNDHFAHGKLDVGFRLLTMLKTPLTEILFIGDTLHDAEVARALGVDCVLISNGHQSADRLQSAGTYIFSSLTEIGFHL